MAGSAFSAFPGSGTVTKKVMLTLGTSVDINTNPVFPDADTGQLVTMFVVPSDYASGDITVRFMIRGSGTSGNTAVFRRDVYRLRDGAAISVLVNNANENQTGLTFDVDILRSFTIPAANFQPGDIIRFDLTRLGLDGADTYASNINWDGGWAEYAASVG